MDAGAKAAGREIFALALRGDIGLVRRRAFDRLLPQLVRRPKGVEHQARIGQQVLPSLLFQAHRIGKDRERIGLREIGNRVETSARQQFVDLGGGHRREMIADPFHRRRRQHLGEHRPRPGMRRRVRLQDDALRAPRLFFGEIAQAHAAARAKRQGVVKDGMHLRIAGHAVDAPFVEPHQRPGLAEGIVDRVRILEKLVRERVHVQARHTDRCRPRRGYRICAGGLAHVGLLHIVLAERYALSLCLGCWSGFGRA